MMVTEDKAAQSNFYLVLFRENLNFGGGFNCNNALAFAPTCFNIL